MILVCSGLALDRFTHDSSLFRFGFRQVYYKSSSIRLKVVMTRLNLKKHNYHMLLIFILDCIYSVTCLKL
jgi:hypothetical protein